MAQNDLSLANADGATFRADANSALQALGTLQSGATAPSTTYPYQWWADTTANQLKQRNAANSAWIVRDSILTHRDVVLDGDDDTSIRADTDDLIVMKLGGVDLFRFDGQGASLVNGLDFLGSDSGGVGDGPVLRAVGSDTHIAIIFEPKGDGEMKFRCHNYVVEESDNGAGTGPITALTRLSTSPAASDTLASVKWRGNNDNTPQDIVGYGEIVAVIVDPTNASEDGRLDLRTIVAGTEDARVRIGAGLWTKNATGGDQSADSLNAKDVYIDGGARLTAGSGTPEGAVTAAVGSLFMRTDGGAATSLYVKESGAGNTGWVAK